MKFLDILFPPNCVCCNRLGKYLCRFCQEEVIPFSVSLCPMCDRPSSHFQTHTVCKTQLGLDGLHITTIYNQPIRQLLGRVKYQGQKDAFRAVDTLIRNQVSLSSLNLDVIVPVPMHSRKKTLRGFNQADILAAKYARFLDVHLSPQAIIKTVNTTPQAEKNKEQRTIQEQCFSCVLDDEIRGKKVGIVDDVTTTRTTLLHASKVLKEAGAIETWGIVLAHPY